VEIKICQKFTLFYLSVCFFRQNSILYLYIINDFIRGYITLTFKEKGVMKSLGVKRLLVGILVAVSAIACFAGAGLVANNLTKREKEQDIHIAGLEYKDGWNLVSDADDYYTMCEAVNAGGEAAKAKYRVTNDLTVAQGVGMNVFSGSFDGGGHSINQDPNLEYRPDNVAKVGTAPGMEHPYIPIYDRTDGEETFIGQLTLYGVSLYSAINTPPPNYDIACDNNPGHGHHSGDVYAPNRQIIEIGGESSELTTVTLKGDLKEYCVGIGGLVGIAVGATISDVYIQFNNSFKIVGNINLKTTFFGGLVGISHLSSIRRCVVNWNKSEYVYDRENDCLIESSDPASPPYVYYKSKDWDSKYDINWDVFIGYDSRIGNTGGVSSDLGNFKICDNIVVNGGVSSSAYRHFRPVFSGRSYLGPSGSGIIYDTSNSTRTHVTFTDSNTREWFISYVEISDELYTGCSQVNNPSGVSGFNLIDELLTVDSTLFVDIIPNWEDEPSIEENRWVDINMIEWGFGLVGERRNNSGSYGIKEGSDFYGTIATTLEGLLDVNCRWAIIDGYFDNQLVPKGFFNNKMTIEYYQIENDETATKISEEEATILDVIELKEVSRPGFEFLGWDGPDSKKGSQKDGKVNYYAGDTYTVVLDDEYLEGTNIVKFYACWKPIEYFIRLYHYGGELTDTTEWKKNGAFYRGSAYYNYLVDIPDATQEGYVFGGWYYDSSYNSPLTGDLQISSPTFQVYELHAKFTPETYTIKFDNRGGSKEPESLVVTYNEEVDSVTPPTFKRDGKEICEFMGYFDNVDGVGEKYFDEDGNFTKSLWNYVLSVGEEKILYAHWIPIVNVYIDYNFAGKAESPQKLKRLLYEEGATYGTLGTLKNPDGYTFAGWKTNYFDVTGFIDFYKTGGGKNTLGNPYVNIAGELCLKGDHCYESGPKPVGYPVYLQAGNYTFSADGYLAEGTEGQVGTYLTIANAGYQTQEGSIASLQVSSKTLKNYKTTFTISTSGTYYIYGRWNYAWNTCYRNIRLYGVDERDEATKLKEGNFWSEDITKDSLIIAPYDHTLIAVWQPVGNKIEYKDVYMLSVNDSETWETGNKSSTAWEDKEWYKSLKFYEAETTTILGVEYNYTLLQNSGSTIKLYQFMGWKLDDSCTDQFGNRFGDNIWWNGERLKESGFAGSDIVSLSSTFVPLTGYDSYGSEGYVKLIAVYRVLTFKDSNNDGTPDAPPTEPPEYNLPDGTPVEPEDSSGYELTLNLTITSALYGEMVKSYIDYITFRVLSITNNNDGTYLIKYGEFDIFDLPKEEDINIYGYTFKHWKVHEKSEDSNW